MVFGLLLGGALGALPLAGNIGRAAGAGIGLSLGLIIGAISDDLGGKLVAMLFSIVGGGVTGTVLGALLSRASRLSDLAGVGLWWGMGVGLVVGAILDVRRARRA
jgi:hypothetical protein